MSRISRRGLLKLSGTGAVAAGSGGLAGVFASGHAPAYAQGTTVHWLKWNDFVPAADEHLRKVALPAAEKALGFKINLETIGLNDLQARVTAGIQSKAGADIIMAFNNHPHLYAESLADVSGLCEEVGSAQGGYYNMAKGNCHNGKRWLAVPYCVIGGLIAWRKSWFAEVGATSFPKTWDEYRVVGKKLKAKGHPLGQSLGHSVGDPVAFCYPFMWSFGGKEVEADGKTVAINSKGTIDSIKFMAEFWKDAHDDGGLAWDDSSNNRAFLSGTISATLNGASIYIETLRKRAQYKTEAGAEMHTDILHAPLPAGPAGQSSFQNNQSMMVMGYSKNQKAATDFLRWFHTPANYEGWFTVQKGFACGPTKSWATHKMWDEDPVMAPFRDVPANARVVGHAGLPNQKAAESLSKYIVVDMYAKAVQGMPAEQAVAWAEGELKKIYSV
ncbi:MAG: extracellular solute-binding protein [Acetobacteraceae bacterium]|nr:extracellular solute-binding protein [Acetobacteraceae bacterium]